MRLWFASFQYLISKILSHILNATFAAFIAFWALNDSLNKVVCTSTLVITQDFLNECISILAYGELSFLCKSLPFIHSIAAFNFLSNVEH